MALTTTVIQEGKSKVSSLQSLVGDLQSYCSNFESEIQNNADFQVFIQQTTLGADLNVKLQELMKIISNSLVSGLEEVTSRTSGFLNKQQELNDTKF